ncbi:MAG: VWA domain-containing protein [bacterium]
MAEKEEPKLEERKWYQNAKAVAGLVTVIVGAIVGIISLLGKFDIDIAGLFKSPDATPTQHIVIVLDASEAMNSAFDGSTKFEIARQVVSVKMDKNVLDSDNLALRLFGGDCSTVADAKSTWNEVGFSQNNKKKVAEALEEIKPGGETTLVSALNEAVAELIKESQGSEDVSKKLIVIAGRFDSCPLRSVDDIEERKKELDPEGKIKMDIQFFGMAVPESDREKFKRMSEKTGGRTFFANNQKELELAMTQPDLKNQFDLAKQEYMNQRFEQARPDCEKAAADGLPEAMTLLGNLTYHGKGGLQKDHKKAADYYRQAADLNDHDAMLHLANMTSRGEGVQQDNQAAFALFKKSAELGNVDAMNSLAFVYEKGQGVAKNPQQAAFWRNKAASAETVGQK